KNLLEFCHAEGDQGDTLVLRYGEARQDSRSRPVVNSALRKKEDEVEIEFTGLRPGEKLIEELFYPDEVVCNTSCPKIKKARDVLRGWNKLESQLDDLELLCISTVRLPFVQKLSKSFLSIPVIQPRFIH